MVKRAGWVIGVLLVLGVGAPAWAANLNFSGTLVLTLGTLPPLTIVKTGTATATLTGSHIDTIAIPSGVFTLSTLQVPITDPNVSGQIPLLKFQNIHNGASTLVGGSTAGPGLHGALGIGGNTRVCLFSSACALFLDVPLTSNGTKGLGIGGTITASAFGIQITGIGNTWTVGQVTVNGLPAPTPTAAITGFATPASSTAGPPGGTGTLQIVTGTKVITTAAGTLPLFAIMTLQFVPEPSAALLGLSAAGALALLGLRRRASRD